MTLEWDRGLLLGDGLFETVLWEGGRLRRWPDHVARLTAGCATLGLPVPDLARLEASAREAVASVGLAAERAAVRLTWTAGDGRRGLDRPETPAPRLLAGAAAAPVVHKPARLVVSSLRRNEGSPTSRVKSLAYLDNVLARAEARAAGADEAVLLNTRGELACAAAANLFWIEGGVLHTPALECGVLAGVTRAAVIRAAGRLGVAVREVRAARDALDRADAVFLTNSLVGLRAAVEIDGRPAGESALPERLRAALD